MVVDTSALVAIVFAEPDHAQLEQAIADDNTRLISAASLIEASLVVASRAGPKTARRALIVLDDTTRSLGLTIEPVTTAHIDLAREAYLRFGRGMGAAALNYGDCFSYALAKESEEPLLFKGEDFRRTDITPCL